MRTTKRLDIDWIHLVVYMGSAFVWGLAVAWLAAGYLLVK